jgi:hypothetical protein
MRNGTRIGNLSAPDYSKALAVTTASTLGDFNEEHPIRATLESVWHIPEV